MPAACAINITALNKRYSEQPVLNNIDLEIPAAKISGLVGRNGAGKTTLIKCISNLVKYEGQISIFSEQFTDNNIVLKKRVGVLMENQEDIFFYLTGAEYLGFLGRVTGLDETLVADRSQELAVMFYMDAAMDKIIYDYSKGMKKKIALMGLFLRNPDLYVLDEPFEGLDSLTIIKVKNILNTLKKNGKTILLSSHILSYVEDIADDICIIHEGRIVFQSATKDIRSKIKDQVTRETFNSLEEIFFTLTSGNDNQSLSWLEP